MQVGDASGIQSPLSFGGFGALTRHMKRLTDALHEALECDAVSKEDLGMINAYNPGLRCRRTMLLRPASDHSLMHLCCSWIGADGTLLLLLCSGLQRGVDAAEGNERPSGREDGSAIRQQAPLDQL